MSTFFLKAGEGRKEKAYDAWIMTTNFAKKGTFIVE